MVGGPRDRVGGLAIEGDVLTHPVWVGQPPIDRLQQCNFSFNMFAQKNANDIKSLDKRSIIGFTCGRDPLEVCWSKPLIYLLSLRPF